MSEYNFAIPGYETREKVLIFSHHHPISFIDRVIFITLLLLLPFIIIAFGLFTRESLMIFASIYYLLWLDIALIEWVKFYYDFFVITESQVIYVEQRTIFSRSVYQCHITQIEESTASVKGILPNLFSYGAIEMQTAGPHENIIIKNIPNPFETSERIMKLHDDLMRKR